MIIAACVMVSVVISSVTANADTKSPARTDSDFVVVAEADGNVDQAAVDRANELLNRLPVQVLKNFQNRGWRFLVTDKNIARTYYSGQYSSVQGMTDYDEKFVMVEQRSKAVEEATLHEFGHYLDWYYNITQRVDSAGNLGVPVAEYADIYNAETGAFTNTCTYPSQKYLGCSMHLRHRKKLWMMRISAWNSLPTRLVLHLLRQ